MQQPVTNNGWNMPPTDFLLFCEFVICWNNEEMLQEQCSNISMFLVQLTSGYMQILVGPLLDAIVLMKFHSYVRTHFYIPNDKN